MRIAVLGLGFMGSTHLKALKRIPGVELVAVASNEPQQLTGDLTSIQGNIGGPGEMMDFSSVAKYEDALEAARDPNAEAVDVCLPTSQHADAAMAALRAGKHVLVEKPMALDGDTACALVAEARRSGRVLMAAQVLRFLPAYRAAADLVKSGRIGKAHAAIFRRRCAAPGWSKWLNDPSQSGGGVFDLLIHDVDYCLHLFAPPEAVSASGYVDAARGIDWILAEFHYRGMGAVGLSGGWHHPKAYPFSSEFTLVCDGGTLEFATAGTPLTLYTEEGEAQALPVADTDGYQAEIEYFIRCASAGKWPEICPPEESAMAVRLARLMVDSRTRNGETIPCKS